MFKPAWIILGIHLFAVGYAATVYPPTNLMYYPVEGCIFVLMWPWARKVDNDRGLNETVIKKRGC